MSNRFGKFHIKIPASLMAEKAALLDLREKQSITDVEFSHEMRKFQKKAMSFISDTNGRYTKGKLPRHLRVANMEEARKKQAEEYTQKLRQELLTEEKEKLSSEVTSDITQLGLSFDDLTNIST